MNLSMNGTSCAGTSVFSGMRWLRPKNTMIMLLEHPPNPTPCAGSLVAAPSTPTYGSSHRRDQNPQQALPVPGIEQSLGAGTPALLSRRLGPATLRPSGGRTIRPRRRPGRNPRPGAIAVRSVPIAGGCDRSELRKGPVSAPGHAPAAANRHHSSGAPGQMDCASGWIFWPGLATGG